MSRDGDAVGPVNAETIRGWIENGKVQPGMHVRDSEGGSWMLVEKSPFGGLLPGSQEGAPAAETQSEALGIIAMLLPLAASAYLWLKVPSMNMLQDPQGTVLTVSFGTVIICAILVAVEASQLKMGKVTNSKGKKDSGPGVWAFAIALVFIVTLPWYLFSRSRYGKKNMVVGGILSALVFSFTSMSLMTAIHAKRSQLQQQQMERGAELRRMMQQSQ